MLRTTPADPELIENCLVLHSQVVDKRQRIAERDKVIRAVATSPDKSRSKFEDYPQLNQEDARHVAELQRVGRASGCEGLGIQPGSAQAAERYRVWNCAQLRMRNDWLNKEARANPGPPGLADHMRKEWQEAGCKEP